MPTRAFRQLWLVFPLLAVTLAAQSVPVVNPGGIINAASYNLASTAVAPGSIATIFGSNLSNGTVCVTPCGPSFDKSGVLIPALAGVSVTFNGIPAPVISVPSSTQISVQVPVETAGSVSAAVVVTVNGQSSAPVNVPISATAPGLFSINASGSGLGAILNATDANQGVVSLAGPWFDFPNSHTAQTGNVLEIYATGLGALNSPVATGTRPVGNPQTATMPTVTIGGVPATVQFSGEAPCCVGLNQINVVVPSGVSAMTANLSSVPVLLTVGDQSSNTVTIAMGGLLSGFSGTAQTVAGVVNNDNVTHLGLDLNPPATATGSYSLSGAGSSSGGQTIYSLTGSGSGTVSSCLLAGSTDPGNWTATGTMTITVSPQGGVGELLGSFSASTSFTLCGTPLPPRITDGGIMALTNPASGAITFLPVIPGGGQSIWPLTGTVDTGVRSLLITGGQIFGSLTQVTGGITVTSSLQSSSDSQPVYTLTGSGSGNVPCSLTTQGGTGTGNWNASVSSTLKLSPSPASLVSGGGSVVGTYSGFSGPASSCGHNLNPINWQGGTVTGTVFPGGGILLWLVPSGSVTAP